MEIYEVPDNDDRTLIAPGEEGRAYGIKNDHTSIVSIDIVPPRRVRRCQCLRIFSNKPQADVLTLQGLLNAVYFDLPTDGGRSRKDTTIGWKRIYK